MGEQVLLPAAAPGPSTGAGRRRSPHERARHRHEPRRAQAHARDPDRRQPVVPRGERARAGGDQGARSANAGPISSPATPRRPRCRRRSRRSSPRASIVSRPRTNGCSRRPRSSARACRSRFCWRWPSSLKKSCGAGSRICRRPSCLYETRLFPDLEYTFKHSLTHEVTYGGLLQERRRDLHARLVDAIEVLHRDRLGEQIERLAHHAVRGEVWDKAVALSPAGGTESRCAVGAPGSPELVRAGAGDPRDLAGEPVHARAGLRDPPRAAAAAGPAR